MSSDAAADRDNGGTPPRALRALAHPTRLDLLDLLRLDGPLTASECAEHLGLTPKVCSYHLHTLATHGFVEETGERSGRARPWRLLSERVGYVHREDEDTGSEHAADEFARVLLHRDAAAVERFVAGRHELPDAWRNVSTMSSNRLELSPDQLAALSRELVQVVERYEAASAAGTESDHETRSKAVVDARRVRVALYAIPELPPGE